MDNTNVTTETNNTPVESEKPKKKKSGKKIFGVIVFILGIATLIGGLTFMLINFLKPPIIRDADYLVKVSTWQLKDDAAVVWNFTEIGKGSLTTNAYINEYDFIWRMDNDILKIETDWLYTLNDEYVYQLDQNEKILTLTSGEDNYTFVPIKETEETN